MKFITGRPEPHATIALEYYRDTVYICVNSIRVAFFGESGSLMACDLDSEDADKLIGVIAFAPDRTRIKLVS